MNGDCERYDAICSDGAWGSSDVVDAVLELEQTAEACEEVSEEKEEPVEGGVHTTRPVSLSRGELGLVVVVGQVYPG